MLARLRAIEELAANEKCPGERVCTTDVVLGQIARRAGETLESFCKPERCRLFHTKQDAIPHEFFDLLQSANRLTDRQLSGLPLPERLSWWEEEAFIISQRCRRILENERAEKDKEESNGPGSLEEQMHGDSQAFAWDRDSTPAEDLN